MHLRSLALTVLGILTFAGCGADSIKGARGPAKCPPGTAAVGVKDVLPAPPPGTEIVPPDPTGSRDIKASLRQEAGDSMRSIYARVVAKPGRVNGTGVYVANLDEAIDPRDLIAGANSAAREIDVEPEPLTIAGEDAVLVSGPGGVVATGAVGDCSAVTLVGTHETQVRAVAEQLQRAD